MIRPEGWSALSAVDTFFDTQPSFSAAASRPGEAAEEAGPARTAPSERPPPVRSLRKPRYSVSAASLAAEPDDGAGGASTTTRSAEVVPAAFTSRKPASL